MSARRAIERPSTAPPITSVVQCSPNDTRDTSIRITIPQKNPYVPSLMKVESFNLYIKNEKTNAKNTILRECPEGYDASVKTCKPGKSVKWDRKNILGGPGCSRIFFPISSITCANINKPKGITAHIFFLKMP